MGKRRIRILRFLYPDIVLLGVDTREDRQKEVADTYGIQTGIDFYQSFQQFSPDAVFICSSPLSHATFVLHALKAGVHTFSEINLNSSGYDQIIRSAKKKNMIAFLSSTALYRKEMEWIIRKVGGKKMAYRYHVGQYLPDWHPWESYSDFFVASKETNAVRELMAIEFPWIFKAFGKMVDYSIIKGRVSKLDFGYPDVFHIIFRHGSGTMGTITIDCVSIKACRHLEVYSDEHYYYWRGLPDSLETYSRYEKKMIPVSLYDDVIHEDQYDANIIENPYIEEIKEFFLTVKNASHTARFSYAQDMEVLKIIDKIEACE